MLLIIIAQKKSLQNEDNYPVPNSDLPLDNEEIIQNLNPVLIKKN